MKQDYKSQTEKDVEMTVAYFMQCQDLPGRKTH